MLACGQQARATSTYVDFYAPGISGSLTLTYGAATDANYSNAFEITGISGTFTDTNNGLNIVNAAVSTLQSINNATPELTNLLAPHDFSRFAVATGLSPQSNGYLTYDNLYWPGGSPQTASDYAPHGGLLDIYGLMFQLPNGDVVDLWSGGTPQGGLVAPYGIAVATSRQALDYNFNGVRVPEPGSFAVLGAGLLALAGVSLRSRRRSAPGA